MGSRDTKGEPVQPRLQDRRQQRRLRGPPAGGRVADLGDDATRRGAPEVQYGRIPVRGPRVLWHSSDGLDGTVPGAEKAQKAQIRAAELSLSVVECR